MVSWKWVHYVQVSHYFFQYQLCTWWIWNTGEYFRQLILKKKCSVLVKKISTLSDQTLGNISSNNFSMLPHTYGHEIPRDKWSKNAGIHDKQFHQKKIDLLALTRRREPRKLNFSRFLLWIQLCFQFPVGIFTTKLYFYLKNQNKERREISISSKTFL